MSVQAGAQYPQGEALVFHLEACVHRRLSAVGGCTMLEKFTNSPNEYGEVSFYWWVGEEITKERLLWQLNKLKDKHICALQINYCHSDSGGQIYGLTMDSKPPLFSHEWWELVGWFMCECKLLNISVSLSDYTIGAPGQGYYSDTILDKYPEHTGQMLVLEKDEIIVKTVPFSINPMSHNIGKAVIEEFYGLFEKKYPGECGSGFNYFFSDELSFNIEGNLWSDDFAKEFENRKGYDITPYLKGIFEDIGDITPKIRLDYYDVIVQLSEERYFIPIYKWHQERAMIFGCDHGGRGQHVNEFGDYFRTQRWMQAPGNDQPRLSSNIIQNKVSSSIAHLYNRPRTWLEGFYGSGWGTSSSELADAVFRNFALGHNLLTLHGLYYTTYGGFWEWAPPCNHFRMPYWEHMGKLLECTKRLSHLLSSGVHVCDVAILYPVAAVEGGEDGANSVDTAFEIAELLYKHTIDFDFIDFESISRSVITGNKLCVSGEEYRIVIVPSMKTIRYSTIEKLHAFSNSGGTTVIFGALPQASDRVGRKDNMMAEKIQDILSKTPNIKTPDEILRFIQHNFAPDIKGTDNPFFLHRRIDGKDVYMIYGAKKNSVYHFRAKGRVHLFNPWNGEEREIPIKHQSESGTMLAMPLSEAEAQILVFDKTKAPTIQTKTGYHTDMAAISGRQRKPLIQPKATCLTVDGAWEFELLPTMDNTYGDFRMPAFDSAIGAEGRFFRFSQGDKQKEIMYSYGTYFYKLGALPQAIDEQLLAMDDITTGTAITIQTQQYHFEDYIYSQRFGRQDDVGPQGSYHGLKGKISDEFICLGSKKTTKWFSDSIYLPEGTGYVYYMYTTVTVDEETKVFMKEGSLKAAKIYINGVPQTKETTNLQQGLNKILLRYDSCGRTFFILDKQQHTNKQTYPLAMNWYANTSVLKFNPCPDNTPCCFKITSPPATQRAKLTAYGDITVSFDGIAGIASKTGVHFNGANIYSIEAPVLKAITSEIAIHVGSPMVAAEAAITEPLEFIVEKGLIQTGDWAEIEGLRTYSGGARYTKIVTIPPCESAVVDLGEVGCSAELFVNAISAGIKLAPPYVFDITPFIQEGENKLEAVIYNTLYNHYLTIPTHYNIRKQKSGLIGPVKISIIAK